MINIFPHPITVITPPCALCGARSKMELPVEPYLEWLSGKHISETGLATLSQEDRLLLIEGDHQNCWAREAEALAELYGDDEW
ncbi:MAG: hypothetical protein ACO3YX_06315 [Candidatus Nanopelagicaceae bacterium]